MCNVTAGTKRCSTRTTRQPSTRKTFETSWPAHKTSFCSKICRCFYYRDVWRSRAISHSGICLIERFKHGYASECWLCLPSQCRAVVACQSAAHYNFVVEFPRTALLDTVCISTCHQSSPLISSLTPLGSRRSKAKIKSKHSERSNPTPTHNACRSCRIQRTALLSWAY